MLSVVGIASESGIVTVGDQRYANRKKMCDKGIPRDGNYNIIYDKNNNEKDVFTFEKQYLHFLPMLVWLPGPP